MTPRTIPSLDPTLTLRELVAARPETLAILTEYGMDACCGGDITIERAAKAHGVELERLMERLKAESGRLKAES
jgi:regulator of cell morphogenesis and NO signaling